MYQIAGNTRLSKVYFTCTSFRKLLYSPLQFLTLSPSSPPPLSLISLFLFFSLSQSPSSPGHAPAYLDVHLHVHTRISKHIFVFIVYSFIYIEITFTLFTMRRRVNGLVISPFISFALSPAIFCVSSRSIRRIHSR